MASQRELNLILRLKDKVSGELKGVAGKMDKVGRQMQGVGRRMTTGLTLPIVGAGAAALKFSTDFEDAAQQVASTANLTTDEVDRLKDGVDEVARSTGEASDEIFSAMQKAVSGSLDLAESQQLVEKTTKAAAAGFGENERLIDVTTTAYDLFNDQVDSADQILDNLVRGAQSTQVNVENMAGAFSRVASIGAGMNLQNEELIASLGVVAERMGDTQRAGRAFTQMLSSVQKPSGEAEGAILKVFDSMDQFSASIQDDLLGTLSQLRDGLEENDMKLADVFTTTQSLDAANLLLADSGERASEVLGEVQNSAGAVNDAFEKSESFQRSLNRLWQEAQSALRPLGDTIKEIVVPAVEGLIDTIRSVSKWFQNLSGDQQKLIVIAAGIVAALGPVLTILGTMAIAISAISGPVLAVVAGLGALVAVGIAIAKNWDRIASHPVVQKIWSLIKQAVGAVVDSLMSLWDSIKQLFGALKPLLPMLKVVGALIGAFIVGSVATAIGIFKLLVGAINLLIDVFSPLLKAVSFVIGKIGDLFIWLWDLLFGNSIIPDMIDGFNDFVDFLERIFGGLVDTFKNIWGSIKSIFESGAEAVMRVVDPIIDIVGKVKSIGSAVGSKIGGAFKSVIPGLAEGGIVRQPTLAMVGEAGPEAVVPLNKSGGMGNVTVNINGGFYLDRNAGEELADAIGDELRRRLRL